MRPTKWLAIPAVAFLLVAIHQVSGVTEPKNNFRFSILGDRTGSAQDQVYGRVWREIDLLHPDFVINVGDTIQGGIDDVVEEEWADLQPIWKRYAQYPLYFTPGNHDIFSDKSRRVFERVTGRRAFYSFNYQDAHITVLDNSQTEGLADEQIRFLTRDLEANKTKSPKFVFLHQPFWIFPLIGGDTGFPLHQVARKYGVEYVISGHAHQLIRLVRDGVAYLAVGSSGGSLRGPTVRGHGFKEGLFYHHVWVTVKGSKAFFTVKELDGAKGAGRMFRLEDWEQKGPSFDVDDPAAGDKPES